MRHRVLVGLGSVAVVVAALVPLSRPLSLRDDAARAEAVVAAADVPALARSSGSPDTVAVPLLRVERVPELLTRPVADRRLAALVAPLAAEWPEPFCLDVHQGGRPVLSVGEDAQIPASVQKLFTAVAVLELMAPDEVFVTRVLADASPVDGAVAGNLYLVGGGDPVLATEAYAAAYSRQPQLRTPIEGVAEAVVAAGVSQVGGALVVDESRYDEVRYVASWPDRYIDQANSGPLSALAVNDGFTDWVPRREAADSPAVHAGQVLRDLLAVGGVGVGGGVRTGSAPADAVAIAEISSPPVSDLVMQMLRESDNNTAELLLKEVGLRASGDASTAAGATAVTDIVDALLAGRAPTPVSVDGSGLDRGNLTTCAAVTAVLDDAGLDSVIGRGLPVAGRTGTLAHRFVDTEVVGELHAKTGLLNNVNGLAGFVDGDVEDITFAQLLNGIPLPGRLGLELQEGLASLLVAAADGLDPDAISP